MKNGKLNLAICISGGGTTMREVLRACESGRLPHVNPALVISSNRNAGGVSKALAERFPQKDIAFAIRKEFPNRDAYGETILRECRIRDVDMIFQCGFIPVMPANVIKAYKQMIANQHPGPLDYGRPGFGGEGGMYGRAVHHAVLYFAQRAGRPFKKTEATVHRVTEEVDKGEILGIKPVEIMAGDDAEKLAARVLPYEHELVIETLLCFSEFGGEQEFRHGEPLIRPGEEALLKEAKAAGKAAFPNG
ncbi:MAG TPA: formyltransferase family protein [Candidatus Paceibacterota bacterium]|nr:formyltransferase family protein [Candidatus Paceibacterota bacterium]